MTSTDRYAIQSPFTALERARRERLLLAISTATIAAFIPAAVLYGILMILHPSWQLAIVVISGPTLVLTSLFARHLAHRGKAELGSYLLLIHLLLVTGLVALAVEGIFPLIAPAYAVIIVVGNMVLGATGSYVTASAAAAMWVGAWAITETGVFPPAPLPGIFPAVPLVGITLLIFFFIAYLGQLATRDLRRALDDATYDVVEVNRELEEADRLRTQFMARMSHELRTPLNAIINYTDLAIRDIYGPLNEMQADAHTRVLRNAKRLQALINDLLDLSRIEAGQLELVEATFPVEALVESVRSALEPAALDKGLRFSIVIDPDMPPYVIGDEHRITQILTNLVDNAIKFTEHGEVIVKIGLLSETQWRLEVRDTGRGIHEEEYDRIFDEFRRGESAGSARGAGLGLAITRHLVEMMKGDIRLTSQIGKGSAFEVSLPLKVAVATPSAL